MRIQLGSGLTSMLWADDVSWALPVLNKLCYKAIRERMPWDYDVVIRLTKTTCL